MTIGTLTGTYEDEFDRLSTSSTMAEGGNRKPAGELKDDSGTQVASSNKPIAPTWRDLEPSTYTPPVGAPSQQPKPEPKPLPIKQGLVDMSPDEDWVKEGEPIPDDWERFRKHPEGGLIVKRGPRLESPQQLKERGVKPPLSDSDIKGPEDLTKLNDQDLSDTDRMVKALKGVLSENKLNDKAWADWLAQAPESSNIEDRRQEPPMDKLEYVARDIWNAYSKAWKSVLGIDNSIPQKMADEDVRKGKVIKPEFGAPGPSGGGTKSGQVIPKEVLEQKQTEQAFKKLGEQLAKKEEDKYIRDAMERAYKDWVADIKGFGEPVKKTYPRDRFFEHEGRIHVTQPADDYFKARAHQQLNEQLRKTLGEEQWNKLLKSNPVDITPLK